MVNSSATSPSRLPRVLVIGVVGVIVLLGFLLIARLAGFPTAALPTPQTDALANSTDPCVECHRRASPGIVQQFSHSAMAAAKVACSNCHVVAANYPGGELHEGSTILQSPTTAMCQKCHPGEVAQFYQSRHSLPAWVAVEGSKDLAPTLMTMYQSIPEGQFAPDKARNAIAAL